MRKLKAFDYREINSELMVPEIMNLVSKIHEYKGKQELFMKVKSDILEAMLEVGKIQSTGASNYIIHPLRQTTYINKFEGAQSNEKKNINNYCIYHNTFISHRHGGLSLFSRSK